MLFEDKQEALSGKFNTWPESYTVDVLKKYHKIIFKFCTEGIYMHHKVYF